MHVRMCSRNGRGVYQILPGVQVSGANQNEWYNTQVILVDRD